jgi:Flp pilus assembly CpaE family ATPase
MVITLYADRRFHDIADLAEGLAHAMASHEVAVRVAVSAAPQHGDGAPATTTHVDVLPPGNPGEVSRYLDSLSPRVQVTLVALGGAPNEQVLATLDASDRVLLVSDPTVTSLRATQRALRLCASLGYGSEKVSVLLHGFTDETPIVPAEAAAILKRDILGVIPGPGSDPVARASAFRQLAERLTERL